MAQLQGRQLYDVVAVVTRYFGGTKLGVGGLARAYGGATAKTLDRAQLITVIPRRPAWIEHSYEDTVPVQIALRALKLSPVDSQYAERVRLELAIPFGDWARAQRVLKDCSGGRLRFSEVPL